jgi:competence protein ComEA
MLLLVAGAPRGKPVQLAPQPTAPPAIVYVSGAVVHPGVYPLAPGARVQDALLAAGGMLPEADDLTLNLAAIIQDGQRLWVPFKTTDVGQLPAPQDSQAPPLQTATSGQVNINTADQATLESLPGIGPVTAQKIIAYRQTNGPFATIEDIQLVSGIGPATFEKIKDLIAVAEMP